MNQQYEVSLSDDAGSKVIAIKLVREYRGIGLAEAKDLVDHSMPVTLVSGVTKDQARGILKHLKDSGVIGTAIDINTGVRLEENDTSVKPQRANDTYEALKCPKCGCGLIEHLISEEQSDTGLMERLRRKFGKRYECRNCGFTWK